MYTLNRDPQPVPVVARQKTVVRSFCQYSSPIPPWQCHNNNADDFNFKTWHNKYRIPFLSWHYYQRLPPHLHEGGSRVFSPARTSGSSSDGPRGCNTQRHENGVILHAAASSSDFWRRAPLPPGRCRGLGRPTCCPPRCGSGGSRAGSCAQTRREGSQCLGMGHGTGMVSFDRMHPQCTVHWAHCSDLWTSWLLSLPSNGPAPLPIAESDPSERNRSSEGSHRLMVMRRG